MDDDAAGPGFDGAFEAVVVVLGVYLRAVDGYVAPFGRTLGV